MACAPPEPPKISERYRLICPVARGGTAEIWKATDVREDRTVAVKRLLASGTATSDHRRLLREAEALRDMAHPNIVRYLDVGLAPDSYPFIVLEWLEGEDLAARQEREPLDVPAALDVVRQALAGLSYAHEQGIVHRDIAPRNLFLPAGDSAVKLLDFGLASHARSVMDCRRRDGSLVGTLLYMAPEQLKGDLQADLRVDLYAVGVVLYELTTGRLPFLATDPAGAVLQIVSETPPWPTEINPGLPAAVEDVIMQALRRSPADRFASAAEMTAALAADGAAPAAAPDEGPVEGPVEVAPTDPAPAPEPPTAAEESSDVPDEEPSPAPRSPRPSTPPPQQRYMLFGGLFRRWPRARVLVGFSLALALGALVPVAYAGRVSQEQLRPLERELATARANAVKPPGRDPKTRTPRTVLASIEELRWRQFLITLGIWSVCFSSLSVLWFRFC